MTLVVPRMASAVAGFVSKHGTWPTKLVVPADNWRAYRENPATALTGHDHAITHAILSRLEFVPTPGQLYVAVDADGRTFQYGEEDLKEGCWTILERSLTTEVGGGLKTIAASDVRRPIPNAYVVPGFRLVAGEYPGSPPTTTRAGAEEKLAQFLHAGITAFVDLTEPADGLTPYEPALREIAAGLGVDVRYDRLPIRDLDVCEPAHMRRILDVVDARLAEGRGVYVHCWGGVGRTGMVVGCWLVRHGVAGEDALRQVGAMFQTMAPDKLRRHAGWGSPQTEEQRAVVRGWQD